MFKLLLSVLRTQVREQPSVTGRACFGSVPGLRSEIAHAEVGFFIYNENEKHRGVDC